MEKLRAFWGKLRRTSSGNSQSSVERPELTQARERAAALTQREWVEEQLVVQPVERLLEVSGIQQAHIKTLRLAGITTLYDVYTCEKLPLMGATGDWVKEWLHSFILTQHREYQKHRRHLEKSG